MFRINIAIVTAVALLLAGCATNGTASETARKADTIAKHDGTGSNKPQRDLSPRDAVAATERAFARTMADRDFDAFKSFLSDEAIFISGPIPLRGKKQVAAAWQPYFESPDAPFSWGPEQVVVLDSEGLAFSTGPVFGPDGAAVGVFNSVWRREAPGLWLIVFDKGGCVCD